MKKRIKFLSQLATVLLFLITKVNFGQVPNLRTSSDFILFTTTGNLLNTGVSEIFGGAIGTNNGTMSGFDNVNCVKHINDAVTPVYNNTQVYLISGQTIQLPVALPRGLYFTRLTVNNHPIVSKIVVL